MKGRGGPVGHLARHGHEGGDAGAVVVRALGIRGGVVVCADYEHAVAGGTARKLGDHVPGGVGPGLPGTRSLQRRLRPSSPAAARRLPGRWIWRGWSPGFRARPRTALGRCCISPRRLAPASATLETFSSNSISPRWMRAIRPSRPPAGMSSSLARPTWHERPRDRSQARHAQGYAYERIPVGQPQPPFRGPSARR